MTRVGPTITVSPVPGLTTCTPVPRAQHYGAFVYVYGSAIGDHVGLHPYTNNLNFLGSDDVAEGAGKKLFSLIFFFKFEIITTGDYCC